MQRLFFMAACLLAGVLLSKGDVLTLRPVGDTTLAEFEPNNNSGAKPTLGVGATAGHAGSPARLRALIQFDLSAIPQNAVISSAEFQFHVMKASGALAPSFFEVRKLLVSWNEGTKSGTAGHSQGSPATANETTWRSRFFAAGGGTLWTDAGGKIGTDFASTPSGVTTAQVKGPASYTIATSSQLVADVQDWVANSANNFGWVLMGQSEAASGTARRVASREDPVAANQPSLVINFTVSVSKPVITSAPKPQILFPGEIGQLSVTATGAAPLSYHWFKDNAPIQTETTPILKTSAAGVYRVEVSNAGGTAVSGDVTLAVQNSLPVLSASIEGNLIAIHFPVLLGRTYEVQTNEQVGQTGDWLRLTNFTTEASADVIVRDPINLPKRFYRVQTTPAQ